MSSECQVVEELDADEGIHYVLSLVYGLLGMNLHWALQEGESKSTYCNAITLQPDSQIN